MLVFLRAPVAAGSGEAICTALRQPNMRFGTKRPIVAVANKNARVIWALLRTHEEFRPAI